MPSWKVHIEIAKRVNSKLNFKGKDLEEFMFGNILADINNGFIVEDVSVLYSHKYTHYEDNGGITYINFFNQYKKKIKEPTILGYYIHLYTDYIWNNDYYTKVEKIVKMHNKTSEELKKIKHNDFKLYNCKYSINDIHITSINNIVNKSRLISNISINNLDVEKTLEFLKKDNRLNYSYKFYTEGELDELLEYTIKRIIELVKVYYIE